MRERCALPITSGAPPGAALRIPTSAGRMPGTSAWSTSAATTNARPSSRTRRSPLYSSEAPTTKPLSNGLRPPGRGGRHPPQRDHGPLGAQQPAQTDKMPASVGSILGMPASWLDRGGQDGGERGRRRGWVEPADRGRGGLRAGCRRGRRRLLRLSSSLILCPISLFTFPSFVLPKVSHLLASISHPLTICRALFLSLLYFFSISNYLSALACSLGYNGTVCWISVHVFSLGFL